MRESKTVRERARARVREGGRREGGEREGERERKTSMVHGGSLFGLL